MGRFVGARFKGSGGIDAWPCTGEAVIALPAAEVVPHAHDAIIEELGPDQCRVVMGSWSWIGLATALTRFDADLTAVGPPELRAAFARLAGRCADAAR